jgi:hypothetical protein
MKNKRHKTRFWMILAILNVVAMGYPINLVLHADCDLARIAAVFIFIATVFGLLISDAIGVLIAYCL